MVILRLIFFTFCFLFNIQQISHARIDNLQREFVSETHNRSFGLTQSDPQRFAKLGVNATVDVTATIADFITPVDASAGVEFARGKISGTEFVERQGITLTVGKE